MSAAMLVRVPIFLRDLKNLPFLPSASTFLRMKREEGLTLHHHPSRGLFFFTDEYAAHMEAMSRLAERDAASRRPAPTPRRRSVSTGVSS